MSPQSATLQPTAPVAGWLTKMISLPFGRTRWISRYFVLLDSELRFYKDEHSDSPSQVLNLRQVFQVIPAPTAQHPFCFRLEPKKQQQSLKPWVIECKNEFDMDNWMCSIKERIAKHSPIAHVFDTKHKRLPSAVSVNTVVAASPAIYRSPILPLRCTNAESDSDEEAIKKDPLLSRRKQTLPHIITDPILIQQHQQLQCIQPLPEQQPIELDISPQATLYNQKRRRSSFQLPSAISSSSTLPSPTGAVIGPVEMPENFENRKFIKASLLSHYQSSDYFLLNRAQPKDNYKPQLISQPCSENDRQKECEISLESPTFLMYKKRFHLQYI